MKLIFELSGEHPLLPAAEVAAFGTLIATLTQVAIAEYPAPSDACRLAYTHTVCEYLGECSANLAAFRDMLTILAPVATRPFAGRAKKVWGSRLDCGVPDLERAIGDGIRGSVSLSSPEEEFRALVSGDRIVFGRVIWKADPRVYAGRKPGGRPFFHPGVMMPKMARALVNLSRADAGHTLLDPFCGTGGFLLEASLLGIPAIGIDSDLSMAAGSRINLPGAAVMVGDARQMPVKDAAFAAVVTDFPYGQSVTVRAESPEDLWEDALGEIARVVTAGGRAVVVTHREIRCHVPESLIVEAVFAQRVHKSLTRHVMVLRRKENHP